ncbi:efflux RND transporter permease subunit [Leptospira borgpetersenii]|uniref:efflux RND transporter permease subunit n=1 Tax=Leptospira borgpetersenii TaxID=174 RepID=UPI0007746B71|nr:CusA/CzcA family heavy metal efflux RND transporter [Leptospira borgpetersenii]MBE8398745.1 efflux RND transporter permease subunit [Leptospira borgpetersenii serovar Tarassovi]MBE8404225.1 efflux RND transporter permease subunit [Leptospira borgpetersenii serovar Tarassovi]MBE8407333.1 efflux RND transporter permease subunit [Leptospira borgpetersenii serovar Tarassovi]MBE8411180.1 efflux RND transporter permease subunit [Leptospira borgpetersenii serovar Tarassovi]MBE8414236.1 efflux RND 
MLSKLLNISLNNPILSVGTALFLFIYSFFTLNEVPIDAVPDITNTQVIVTVKTGSLDPEQIEKVITFPLETELMGIPNLIDVRSISKFGLSNISLIFKEGTDIYQARSTVLERITSAKEKLPKGIVPTIVPNTTGLGEILFYTVEAKPGSRLMSLPEKDRLLYLRTVQDYTVRPQLKSLVPGIVEVDSNGGYEKEIHIDLNPSKMRTLGITIDQLIGELSTIGESFGGGFIEDEGKLSIVRAYGIKKNLNSLSEVTVRRTFTGSPIRVSDIAQVKEHGKQRLGGASSEGKEIVLGTAMMLRGENSYQVNADLNRAALRLDLPEDVQVRILLERSFLIHSTIRTVTKNLSEGAILVILTLCFILFNIKASLIVATIIPGSMLLTAIFMRVFGISANLMSLGAIDFGLLVDASIVITENVLIRFERNSIVNREEKIKTILNASLEVLKPVSFGIVVIMLVYVPIITLDGISGKMFRPMAQTVLLALGFSLILAVFFLPPLLFFFITPTKNISNREVKKNKIVALYETLLSILLNKPKPIVIGSISFFLLTLFIYFRMGTVFLPKLMEGDLMLVIVREGNISIEESLKEQKEVEKILMQMPEIQSVFSRIGTSSVANDPMGTFNADTFIILKKESLEDLLKEKNWENFLNRIHKKVQENYPKSELTLSQPLEARFNELLEGSRADISVRILGKDLNTLLDLQNSLKENLHKIPGAMEVELDPIMALRKSTVIDIVPDPSKLKYYNVSLPLFNNVVEASMSGFELGGYYEEEVRFPIKIRLSEEFRNRESEISNIGVGTQDGGMIPIKLLASIEKKEKIMTISRNKSRRFVAVSVNLRGRDLEGFYSEAKDKISNINIPQGYSVYWGGQIENLSKAKEKLSVILPTTFLMIFVVLYLGLKSVRQALLVFFCVPFALTGGIWFLFLRGMDLSVSAFVGCIALCGISVLNGLVKLDTIHRIREEKNIPLKEAVLKGATSRIRPVIMTALVASFGFLPMAFGSGLGSEVQKPLATVVIGGIVSSTLLTLVILPVFYYWLEKTSEN